MPKNSKHPPPKEETPWERFERLARALMKVPKDAIREPKKDKPEPLT